VAFGSHGFLFDIRRVAWQAHALDIQCDVRYSPHWTTNSFFATRHVEYLIGTNGTIIGTKSNWKWAYPLAFGSGKTPAAVTIITTHMPPVEGGR
jgi:hypothetical protein